MKNILSSSTRTSMDKLALIGFFFSILWCLSTSFANILTGAIEQKIDPLLVCFFTFLITNIFFLLCNIRNVRPLIKKSTHQLPDIFSLNVTTLGCWFLWLYSLKYIEPAISGAIMLGIRPFSTIVLGKLIYKSQRIHFSDYISAILLCMVILYLSYLAFVGKTAVITHFNHVQIGIALLASALSGIILGANTIYTKRLSNAGFSSRDILSIRFILPIIMLGGYIWISHLLPATFANDFFLDIVILAFSLIILPQYFFQEAVAKLEPISVGIMSIFMPILTFFLQYADKALHPTFWTIIGIAGIFIIITINSISRYKTETR